MTRIGLAALACCTLGACGLSAPVIKSQAVHYDDVIEDTTNKLLVLNILRARDKAPLHFAHIPLIHESIQQTATFGATVPFGRLGTSTLRDNYVAGVGVQMVPSFDVQHLDSKDFATGIASPIEPKFVKYWLDRGLDRRIVLLLFFSSAEIVETDAAGVSRTVRIMNSPREAIDVIRATGGRDLSAPQRCDALSDFQRYLKLINSLRTFYARAYTERRLVADNIPLDTTKDIRELQAIAALDPSKVEWVRRDKSYALYAVTPEPRIALCFFDASATSRLIVTGDAAARGGCVRSIVDTSMADGTAAAPIESPLFHTLPETGGVSPFCAQYNRFLGIGAEDGARTLGLRLQIRSVGEIIQFLGDLIEYQDAVAAQTREHPEVRLNLNTPVTFGFCPDVPPGDRATSGCADVFFQLRHDDCPGRFSVSYRGDDYTVGPHDPPRNADAACRTPGHDHTLEILSVVNQLVDLRKSATDIHATPYVQVLP